MSRDQFADIPPTGHKVLKALRDEDLCERDLFIRLRPVDRVALHRLLAEMVRDRHIARRDVGRLPGPVVTTYMLPERQYRS